MLEQKKKKRIIMASLIDYFGCFRFSLKSTVYQSQENFLKQCCAKDRMLQYRSQRLLFEKKVGNIDPFSTNFSHNLEHHS